MSLRNVGPLAPTHCSITGASQAHVVQRQKNNPTLWHFSVGWLVPDLSSPKKKPGGTLLILTSGQAEAHSRCVSAGWWWSRVGEGGGGGEGKGRSGDGEMRKKEEPHPEVPFFFGRSPGYLSFFRISPKKRTLPGDTVHFPTSPRRRTGGSQKNPTWRYPLFFFATPNSKEAHLGVPFFSDFPANKEACPEVHFSVNVGREVLAQARGALFLSTSSLYPTHVLQLLAKHATFDKVPRKTHPLKTTAGLVQSQIKDMCTSTQLLKKLRCTVLVISPLLEDQHALPEVAVETNAPSMRVHKDSIHAATESARTTEANDHQQWPYEKTLALLP